MDTFVCVEPPPLGERYPVDTDCHAPAGEDRSLCDQRLSKQSLSLFQVAGGGIDILWSTQDDGLIWTIESHELLSQRCFVTSEEVEQGRIYQVRLISPYF
jgi:hypothetical protein